MNRALFLDRDGVININTGYCNKVEDFSFTRGIFQLCWIYRRLGFKLIVVTNQAGIELGFLTEADLQSIHAHMRLHFGVEGCPLTAIYHCPDKDGPMRKPEPGMLLQAQREHDIDMAASILIGDQITDIEAGRRAGVGCCILIPPNRLDAVPLPR
jgi:D-glycero-D-manno-heptose 1,7-bisphosphate phosphatase